MRKLPQVSFHGTCIFHTLYYSVFIGNLQTTFCKTTLQCSRIFSPIYIMMGGNWGMSKQNPQPSACCWQTFLHRAEDKASRRWTWTDSDCIGERVLGLDTALAHQPAKPQGSLTEIIPITALHLCRSVTIAMHFAMVSNGSQSQAPYWKGYKKNRAFP